MAEVINDKKICGVACQVPVRQQTENRREIDDCGLENIIPRIVSYQIHVNLLSSPYKLSISAILRSGTSLTHFIWSYGS